MIFITGCARSGTSLTTRILQLHGLRLGHELNGLFENVNVRQNILKPYLRSLGADPLGQDPLPPLDGLPAMPPDTRSRIEHIIGPQEPWGYKDAKLTLCWQPWASAFPEAKWVIVRRPAEKIVDSCLRTSFMSKRSTRESWGEWVAEHERRFEAMKHSLNCIEVRPDDFVDDPEMFEATAEFCELEFDWQIVTEVVNPAQWH